MPVKQEQNDDAIIQEYDGPEPTSHKLDSKQTQDNQEPTTPKLDISVGSIGHPFRKNSHPYDN